MDDKKFGISRANSIRYEDQRKISHEISRGKFGRTTLLRIIYYLVIIVVTNSLLFYGGSKNWGSGAKMLIIVNAILHIMLVTPLYTLYYILYKYDLLELDAIYISQGLITSPVYVWHGYVIYCFFIDNYDCRILWPYTWVAHLILLVVGWISIGILISTWSIAIWLIWAIFFDSDEDESPTRKQIRVKSILIGTAAFKFNPIQFNEGDKCMIWTNQFQDDELVIRLQWDEHHIFHDRCIESWVLKKKDCPICHSPAELDQIVEARKSIRYEKAPTYFPSNRKSDPNLKQRLSNQLFGHMELIDEENDSFN